MDLITHVGDPILKREGETVSELQLRVQNSMKTIIEKNREKQSVMGALLERFLNNRKIVQTDENDNTYGFVNKNIK